MAMCVNISHVTKLCEYKDKTVKYDQSVRLQPKDRLQSSLSLPLWPDG